MIDGIYPHLLNPLDPHFQAVYTYLDFSKYFDSVPHGHERLLMKIGKYGIKGMRDWVADFLRGRHQQVSIRGYLSSIAAVLSGIPQRIILGPLLFVIGEGTRARSLYVKLS